MFTRHAVFFISSPRRLISSVYGNIGSLLIFSLCLSSPPGWKEPSADHERLAAAGTSPLSKRCLCDQSVIIVILCIFGACVPVSFGSCGFCHSDFSKRAHISLRWKARCQSELRAVTFSFEQKPFVWPNRHLSDSPGPHVTLWNASLKTGESNGIDLFIFPQY